MFRFYMSPSFDGDIGSSRTMIVPSTFDITILLHEYEQPNGFLNKISTCVLESVMLHMVVKEYNSLDQHSDGSSTSRNTNRFTI